MRRTLARVALGLLLVPGLARGEQGSGKEEPRAFRMETTVVTASRVEESLGDVPTHATVVEAGEITRSAGRTVDDLLQVVPGFSLFRRSSSRVGHPTTQGVTLRGIAPSGASRTLVLLDGVPLNDPFGGWVYWSRVPREGLKRVEIVRGGGSNVWGNAALGGVIHLLRERPTERTLRATLSGGSRDTVDLHAHLAERIGPLHASLEGAYFDTGGYPVIRKGQRGPIDEDATSEHALVRGRTGFSLGESVELTVGGDYFREDRGNGTPLTGNDTRTGSGDLHVDARTAGGSRWSGVVFGQAQTFSSTFSAQEEDRSSESPALDQFDVPSASVGAGFTWTKEVLGTNVLSAGADVRWIEGETNERFFFDEGRFRRERRAGSEQQLFGGWLQGAFPLTESVRLTAGGRVDLWRSQDAFRRVRNRDSGEIIEDETFRDRDEVEVSPKVGVRWAPVEAVSFRGAFYQAFRAPTVNELVRPFRVRNDITESNADLDPERLTGGEIGVDWMPREALLIRLTGFWNEIRDPIGNVTVGDGPGTVEPCGFVPDGGTCRQRRNLGKSRVRGGEAEAEVILERHWRLIGRVLASDTEIVRSVDDPGLEGKRLAQVPEVETTFRIEYANPRLFTFSLQGRYVGSQFEDDQNRLRLDDVFLLDAFLGREILGGIELFVSAENMTNATIEVGKTLDGLASIGHPAMVHGGLRIQM